MRLLILFLPLLAYSLPAEAGMLTGIDERQAYLEAPLQNKKDYHACLARELAMIASLEKGQHDTEVARRFMDMAEQHAGKAGGRP